MAVFGLMSVQVLVPRASQQPEEIPLETERAAIASDRSVSRLASRHRAAILCDIIINENLKILQINYLARKVDVMFNFPSRSHCTCNNLWQDYVHLGDHKLPNTVQCTILLLRVPLFSSNSNLIEKSFTQIVYQ
jgi:hypothetical protein